MSLSDVLKRVVREAQDISGSHNTPEKTRQVLGELIDVINQQQKMMITQSANADSSEARINKNKYETARKEKADLEKFIHDYVQFITESVKEIFKLASQIPQYKDNPEIVEALGAKINMEVKKIVAKTVEGHKSDKAS